MSVLVLEFRNEFRTCDSVDPSSTYVPGELPGQQAADNRARWSEHSQQSWQDQAIVWVASLG